MHRARWILGAVVVVATAAAVAVALSELREKRRQADAAVNDIESQLDALDPVTRAAVIARVGADAARRRSTPRLTRPSAVPSANAATASLSGRDFVPGDQPRA